MSEIKTNLQQSYDAAVAEREGSETQGWKLALRQSFLDLMLRERKNSLLELGAGTGIHGRFFADAGLVVTATDLSVAMVTACRAKGLDARQMDYCHLDFSDNSFDVVYALNCLLHATPEELVLAVAEVQRVLRPGGLFYWGQYGGERHEGPLPSDNYEPKRYFSLLDDKTMKLVGGERFDPVSFDATPVSHHWNQHFQSSIWRKPL